MSDRVSFELSQEAVEALRAKLVSTPGFGAFGQQPQQSQPQQPPQQQSQHGRPPPVPSLQDPNDPEFKRWKVQIGHPRKFQEVWCINTELARLNHDWHQGLSTHALLRVPYLWRVVVGRLPRTACCGQWLRCADSL